MRRVEQTQHIPVILLTGFGPDHELTSAAFRLGVADLVMKPVDPWSLRTKVRYLYDTHRRHLALEQEIRDLRALVKDHTDPGHTEPGRTAPRRTALPHPDARVPLQRAQQVHDEERDGELEGELEQGRT
jgi:DNA-binding response OmpR family regulator